MKIKTYLFVNSKGSVRIRKTKTSMGADEIAIQVDLTVPNQLFKKPQLQASISIPEDAVQTPVISSEVLDNIKTHMVQELGVNMTIAVLESD